MLLRSATGTPGTSRAGSLSTASDSPVRGASCTRRFDADSSRASAPTASPSERTRTSPTTSPDAGICSSSPSLSTVEWVDVMSFRAATASAARFSWVNPMTALATMMTKMTTASIGQPDAPSATQATTDTSTAPRSRYTSGSASCLASRRQAGSRGFCSVVRPVAGQPGRRLGLAQPGGRVDAEDAATSSHGSPPAEGRPLSFPGIFPPPITARGRSARPPGPLCRVFPRSIGSGRLVRSWFAVGWSAVESAAGKRLVRLSIVPCQGAF